MSFATPGMPTPSYVTNLQMWKSSDGGVSFTEITTPHATTTTCDRPRQPAAHDRKAYDGGACRVVQRRRELVERLQPEDAQFYRLDVDNHHPYRVYARSRTTRRSRCPAPASGARSRCRLHLPWHGESGFVAVHPEDPNIVYCGQSARARAAPVPLQRYDHRTRQIPPR